MKRVISTALLVGALAVAPVTAAWSADTTTGSGTSTSTGTKKHKKAHSKKTKKDHSTTGTAPAAQPKN
jgi:hypothetical protein